MAESEKQYKPTQKRLKKAWSEGQVLKSPVLTATAVSAAMFGAIWCCLGLTWVRFEILINYCLIEGFRNPGICLRMAGQIILLVLGSCLIAGAGAAVLLEMLQVGPGFSPGLILPDIVRLDPFGGLKRVIGGLKQAWLHALKAVLFVMVGYYLLLSLIPTAAMLAVGSNVDRLGFLWSSLIQAAGLGIGILLLIGSLEYALNRKRYLAELSMSREELKAELRESEGDPHVKSTRRTLHEALILQDLVARVRKSKVLVVERAS